MGNSGVIETPGSVGFRLDDFVDVAPVPVPPSSVLIVEDDPGERAALAAMLSPLGYPLVEAASGLDARRCVTDQDFAVILIDVRTMTGAFDTAEFIRSRARSTLTPLIFVTTSDRDEREMTMGYAMGSVDFIVAPVVPAALRGKVALFADLFAKTHELVERAQRLRMAASRSADALGLQMEMLDRMDELSRAKSDFVSKVSHELRSPLTSVIGYVELLTDGGPGDPTPEQARMLTIIERNSRRLLALIEDLLTMSRVEAGIFELSVGTVDLRELIQSVRDTTEPAVARAGLELRVDVGADRMLTGDREQLERALLNLLSNAVKFTSPRGHVEIATRTEGDDALVSVRDTGTGIPLDEQESLFTRFFRAKRSQEQEVPGTGLGLYIVKQIVELHGGAMEVESTPTGSTFTMRLPIGGPPADPLSLVRR
ncbi:MAG: two-component system, sensor histidine kinase and response regulator [Actinomycetota bacterium]|nr:two-component system, sensor histidine kinase and response regulator [Actinomycetota bacterium]